MEFWCFLFSDSEAVGFCERSVCTDPATYIVPFVSDLQWLQHMTGYQIWITLGSRLESGKQFDLVAIVLVTNFICVKVIIFAKLLFILKDGPFLVLEVVVVGPLVHQVPIACVLGTRTAWQFITSMAHR